MEPNHPLYKETLAKAVAEFLKNPERGIGLIATIWGIEPKDIREESNKILFGEGQSSMVKQPS